MKKFIIAGILLCVLAVFSGCKKDKDEDQPKSGISCKIDGTVWESSSVVAQHAMGITQILATNSSGSLQLIFEGGNTGTFGAAQDVVMTYQSGFTSYYSDNEEDPNNQIVITKYDPSTNKIEGTFSFKGRTSNGAIVSITDGKITDVTYIEQ